MGTQAFIDDWLEKRAEEQSVFLERIPEVQDTQCAFQLLLQCAGPRANHTLRTLPPSASAEYAQTHDVKLIQCFSNVLSKRLHPLAEDIARLPFREGGLSLRSAARSAVGAYWASWADCISQIEARAPRACDLLLADLRLGTAAKAPSVREAAEAALTLQAEGFEVPTWESLRDPEFRAPQPEGSEPGDWEKGWQFHACAARDTYFAAQVHLPSLDPDLHALRLSQQGPCASRHFSVLPTAKETTFTPEQFNILLSVRLLMPLLLDNKFCRCGAELDPYGFHRSACSTTGVLKPRGTPAEVCMARICREAGARVKENQMLRDLNVVVPATDTRKIEVIANGLPLYGGKQVAIDTTVVSALTGRGVARGRTAGQALREARRHKRNTYAEVEQSQRCKLVVIACEVGGRWSDESVSFLKALAWYKAQSCPRLLRGSAYWLFFQRWTGLLACAVQRPYAASLLGKDLGQEA